MSFFLVLRASSKFGSLERGSLKNASAVSRTSAEATGLRACRCLSCISVITVKLLKNYVTDPPPYRYRDYCD